MADGGFYQVLGVSQDASDDDIRRAFRTIARTCHPDVAGDDATKAETFRTARAAYEVLSDPERRKEHDRVLQPRPRKRKTGGDGAFFRAFYKRASEAGARDAPPNADAEDLFRDFGFGRGERPRARVRPTPPPPSRGDDVCIDVPIDAERAELGGFVTARYTRLKRMHDNAARGIGPDRDTVQDHQDLHVPPNTRHLAIRRYPGLGDEGAHGGEPGELVVRFRVMPAKPGARGSTPSGAGAPDAPAPSPDVQRVHVPLHDALLGTRLAVDTPAGPVRLVVPPCTSGGKRFRLAGKGAVGTMGTRGDHVVEVCITLPDMLDDDVLSLAQALKAQAALDSGSSPD